jgi:hypothetical protein
MNHINKWSDLAVETTRVSSCVVDQIILPDRDRHPGHADPDQYQFKVKQKLLKYTYPDMLNILSKILKKYDPFDTDEKDKTLLSSIAATKS